MVIMSPYLQKKGELTGWFSGLFLRSSVRRKSGSTSFRETLSIPQQQKCQLQTESPGVLVCTQEEALVLLVTSLTECWIVQEKVTRSPPALSLLPSIPGEWVRCSLSCFAGAHKLRQMFCVLQTQLQSHSHVHALSESSRTRILPLIIPYLLAIFFSGSLMSVPKSGKFPTIGNLIGPGGNLYFLSSLSAHMKQSRSLSKLNKRENKHKTQHTREEIEQLTGLHGCQEIRTLHKTGFEILWTLPKLFRSFKKHNLYNWCDIFKHEI